MNEKKHVEVLTNGGDAPEMNAAVRAVVRRRKKIWTRRIWKWMRS